MSYSLINILEPYRLGSCSALLLYVCRLHGISPEANTCPEDEVPECCMPLVTDERLVVLAAARLSANLQLYSHSRMKARQAESLLAVGMLENLSFPSNLEPGSKSIRCYLG